MGDRDIWTATSSALCNAAAAAGRPVAPGGSASDFLV